MSLGSFNLIILILTVTRNYILSYFYRLYNVLDCVGYLIVLHVINIFSYYYSTGWTEFAGLDNNG